MSMFLSHIFLSVSQYPANKALEILIFRARDRDRMVGRGAALLQHLNVALRLHRDAQQHRLKVLARHAPGATACDENASWLQQLDRELVQPMVRPQRVIDLPLAAGKLGRIEDDRAE